MITRSRQPFSLKTPEGFLDFDLPRAKISQTGLRACRATSLINAGVLIELLDLLFASGAM